MGTTISLGKMHPFPLKKYKEELKMKKTRLVPSGTFPPAAVTITRQLPKKKDKKKDRKKKTPWGSKIQNVV